MPLASDNRPPVQFDNTWPSRQQACMLPHGNGRGGCTDHKGASTDLYARGSDNTFEIDDHGGLYAASPKLNQKVCSAGQGS